MGEGILFPPGRCLFPCVLRVSGSCPVLTFRSPQTNTCPWAWKLLISPSRMEKLSSLRYWNSTGGDIGGTHEIISLLISSQMFLF